MKLNSRQILKTIELNKEQIRKYGVRKIGLFGSYLKGNSNKKSDIDLLVEFDEPTFDNYMDLKFMLEAYLKKKVDLVIEHNLKPALSHVKEDAKYVRI